MFNCLNQINRIIFLKKISPIINKLLQMNTFDTFKSFNGNVPLNSSNYIPDFVYSSMCAEETQQCENTCSNNIYSPVVGGYVHDPRNGKVFCPFGKGDSMNQSTVFDQSVINSSNMLIPNYTSTTWGRAPQLEPRQLAKIGLSWRTS